VVLHLNAALQYQVESRLAAALAKYQAKDGAIIVMDPRTGGILAQASWPTFDPNRYGEFTQGEWGNSAIGEPYEPGSVFKPITYAAALDAEKLRPDDFFEDTGELEVNDKIITNAELKRYGTITARQALGNSVNVVAAQICLEMGSETFYRYVRQFRFGQYTEVDSAPEASGIVKWPNTEYWSRFDQAANSFGQGISVTPLQMVNAIAAIANDGMVLQPQFVQSLVRDGEVYRLPPRTLGRAVKPETARQLTEMMVFTVENYAAGANLVPGYRVAGKTGTAEIPEREGYTSSLTITSFVGFLPAADPQLVVLVKLSEPKSSRWAEQVALPLFAEVARDAVQTLKIAPDNRMP
jgi:cell division protein FtsI/penicillin-binding protein 2